MKRLLIFALLLVFAVPAWAARSLYPVQDPASMNWSASTWALLDGGTADKAMPEAGDTVYFTVNSGDVALDDLVDDGSFGAQTPIYALVDMTGYTGTLTTDAHLRANNIIMPAGMTIVAPLVHTLYFWGASGNVGPLACTVPTRVRFSMLAGDTTLLGDITFSSAGRLIHGTYTSGTTYRAIIAGDVVLPSTYSGGALWVWSQHNRPIVEMELQGDVTGDPTVVVGGNTGPGNTEIGRLILTAGKTYEFTSIRQGTSAAAGNEATLAGTVSFVGDVDFTGIAVTPADPTITLDGTEDQTLTLDGQTLGNVTENKVSGDFNVTVAGDGNIAWSVADADRIICLTINSGTTATQTDKVVFSKLAGSGTLAAGAQRTDWLPSDPGDWDFTGTTTGTHGIGFKVTPQVTPLVMTNAINIGTRRFYLLGTATKTLTVPGLTCGDLFSNSSNVDGTQTLVITGNSSGAAILLGSVANRYGALVFGSGFGHTWTGAIEQGGTGTANAITFGGRVELGGNVTLAGITTAFGDAKIDATTAITFNGTGATGTTSGNCIITGRGGLITFTAMQTNFTGRPILARRYATDAGSVAAVQPAAPHWLTGLR